MKIGRTQYLKALGLWHLAKEHSKKAMEFEDALNAMFGETQGSHISDSIWGRDDDTLDAALERMGVTVLDIDP